MTREEQRAKAAHEYIQSDSVAAGNEVLAFGDFINGAKWVDFHPQWIPVEKELPKCNIVECSLATYPVLVYREDGFIDISCYDSEVGEWDCVSVVTHWMPLPTPPATKKGGNQ